MRSLRFAILAVFLNIGAVCAENDEPALRFAGFKVAEAREAADFKIEFGAVSGKGADAVVKPAKIFPLKKGTVYGWRLRVPGERATVKIKEELVLPKAPKAWEGAEEGTISKDGRTSTTEGEAVLIDGSILHAWSVVEGDPAGHYILRVWVDDKLAGTFEFEFVQPSREGA